jgi:hypothetical protein
MTAYIGDKPTANGKKDIIFRPPIGADLESITLPCRQCIGCRIEHSRQWAIRMTHEQQMHPDNCFLTLTYNDEHLPSDGSINLRHIQNFLKRFRKKFVPKNPYPPYSDARKKFQFKHGIRFFQCGEYGEQNSRPHYHVCVFNFDFPDKVLFKHSNEFPIYSSEILSDLWGKGFCTIGELTFESAAYVARYVTKKITGPQSEDHYFIFHPETGEINDILPEFATMSRNPGLGSTWFKKYQADIYPHDEVVIRGKKMKPPKFYDLLHEKNMIAQHEEIQFDRFTNAQKNASDNTPERLLVRETILKSKLQQLKRTVEKD